MAERGATNGWLIYPARRAVEHAVTQPGVRPTRLFPVLWPLWQVEITADIYDEQNYEVLDRFLVRGLWEGGLRRPDELAAFYGLPRSLVDRCLAYLTLIGHIRSDNGAVILTPIGEQSVRADVRYVPKETRQRLLIEPFTSSPLPRGHYEGSLRLLPTPEVPEGQITDGSRFRHLFAATSFRPSIVEDLARRADRIEYNLPKQLRQLQVLSHQDVFLPSYVIEEARGQLLAYSPIAGERDRFLESVCKQVPMLRNLLAAERTEEPRTIWTEWLANGPHRGTLQQLANGVWRANLTPDSFGEKPKLPVGRIGSYQLRKSHFIQLWTNNRELRQRALMERALGVSRLPEVRSRDDLTNRTGALADQLELSWPTMDQLRKFAERQGKHLHLAHLDGLN